MFTIEAWRVSIADSCTFYLNLTCRNARNHSRRTSVAVRSKAVVLLLLTFCLLLLSLWESVIVLCIVVRYFMSILVLQSSWWGRESWLLCLICLPGVSWWLSGSSSRCHGVGCSLWLWYYLIIHTYLLFIPINTWQQRASMPLKPAQGHCLQVKIYRR